MHVLVCDDDRSTRFLIHRLLVQKLGCSVSDCADGVEALERLAAGGVDLLILDVTMPTLDGLEVLEAIRQSPQFGQLPVIMLSQERREEVVVKLIELGILGYVVKPPRAEPLTALVERARREIEQSSPRANRPSARSIGLDHESPALLVDGDPAYRRFFAAQAEPYGAVELADSGLSALASFKRAPTDLVFIGEQLGVIGADMLVRKLRAMAADNVLRIVAIRDLDRSEQAGSDETASAFDDVMRRSMVEELHQAEMRRFVSSDASASAA